MENNVTYFLLALTVLSIYALSRRENFSEYFSTVIKDTFKRKSLPARFDREFHIDANGHIRTG
jgi:hypothetical protein